MLKVSDTADNSASTMYTLGPVRKLWHMDKISLDFMHLQERSYDSEACYQNKAIVS